MVVTGLEKGWTDVRHIGRGNKNKNTKFENSEAFIGIKIVSFHLRISRQKAKPHLILIGSPCSMIK